VTESPEQLPERRLRELAALADGRLRGRRRRRLEAEVAASPELRALVAEQRRAARAVAGAEVRAPRALRERLAAAGAQPSGERRAGIPIRRLALPALAGAAVAAAALAIVLPGGSAGGPSVVEAAALGQRPPERAAPGATPGSKLIGVSEDGVAFPDWTETFGWRAVGTREDGLDGRSATTVFYEKGGRRASYTIVSGEAIDAPGGSARHRVEGTELDSLALDGRNVVTWLRDGRTCVLSAGGVELETLLELAAWKGNGSVPF
jgi:hypothetical protein